MGIFTDIPLELVEWQKLLAGDGLFRRILAAVVLLAALAAASSWLNIGGGPPRLREGIPFVTNTLEFLRDNRKFMEKAT